MNNDLEQFSEERLQGFVDRISVGNLRDSPTLSEMIALSRIALAAKQAKPIGYIAEVSGNRVGALRGLPLPEIGSLIYTNPQPARAGQSEMLNKAHSLSESIGELRKQIDSSGGYDFEALRSEQMNSPEIPDGWKLVPITPTDKMLLNAMIAGEVDSILPAISRAESMWEQFLAAAPKPESE